MRAPHEHCYPSKHAQAPTPGGSKNTNENGNHRLTFCCCTAREHIPGYMSLISSSLSSNRESSPEEVNMNQRWRHNSCKKQQHPLFISALPCKLALSRFFQVCLVQLHALLERRFGRNGFAPTATFTGSNIPTRLMVSSSASLSCAAVERVRRNLLSGKRGLRGLRGALFKAGASVEGSLTKVGRALKCRGGLCTYCSCS